MCGRLMRLVYAFVSHIKIEERWECECGVYYISVDSLHRPSFGRAPGNRVPAGRRRRGR